jgi:hypothetical protein
MLRMSRLVVVQAGSCEKRVNSWSEFAERMPHNSRWLRWGKFNQINA